MLIRLIFIVSFCGILAIIFKKIPELVQLAPEAEIGGRKRFIHIKKIIDIEDLERRFSLWLDKLFKKFRIYALKFENLSHRLSIKFHEKSKALSESKSKKEYWEKLKTKEGRQTEEKKED